MKYWAVADKLCRRCGTRDPFEIARQLGVLVNIEPLGSVKGYYSQSYHCKVIHINESLDERQRALVCAHELGHALLHPDSNTPFIRENTFYSVNKMEVEANKFAVNLLYSDDHLAGLQEWTIPQIAAYMGLPEPLAEYRMLLLAPKIQDHSPCGEWE